MEERQKITIEYSSKIKPIKPINDQFTLCRCYVLALGENDNNTSFSKETVDDALSTLFNIPVVGHLRFENNGNALMGGHDVEIVKNDKGKFVFKPITIPYGVVPQQNNTCYEKLKESDGKEKTYLTADIILWTGRYPELLQAAYDDDIYFAQSMEIFPLEQEIIDGVIHITKFQFSALCLLGKSDEKSKNVKPCFELARVEPYEFSKDENINKLYVEFEKELAKSYSADNVGKGGKEEMNTEIVKKILLEFGLAEDTKLSFEITDDMTEDDLRAKIAENQAINIDASSTETNTQGDEDVVEQSGTADTEINLEQTVTEEPLTTDNEDNVVTENNETIEFSANSGEDSNLLKFSIDLTNEEKKRALDEAVNSLKVENVDVHIVYWLHDFDDDYAYIHCDKWERGKEYRNYNFRVAYTFSNNKAVLDMQTEENVRHVWLTDSEAEQVTKDKAQLAELIKYQADRIEDDKKKAYSTIISEFSDLGELDEYKEVVKNAMTFSSVDALAEKLYAIRGKHASKVIKKPLNQIRIPVGFEKNNTASEYDEFMETYLAQAKKIN